MKRFKANFHDKHSSETRSLIVEDVKNEDDAEDKACYMADRKGWPKNFKLLDSEELNNGENTDG